MNQYKFLKLLGKVCCWERPEEPRTSSSLVHLNSRVHSIVERHPKTFINFFFPSFSFRDLGWRIGVETGEMRNFFFFFFLRRRNKFVLSYFNVITLMWEKKKGGEGKMFKKYNVKSTE